MAIKANGSKWASKESQGKRNVEYARKASEAAPSDF